MATIDLNGPILANKLLCDNDIVAEDVTCTLPDVEFFLAEYKATGTISLPVPLVNPMEAGITKMGLNRKMGKYCALEPKNFEFRCAQNDLKLDGSNKQTGIKAFIRGTAKKFSGGALTPGETWSGDIAISAIRYQLFVDGVDYSKSIKKLL